MDVPAIHLAEETPRCGNLLFRRGIAFCPPSRAQAAHSESHQHVGWIPLAFLERPIELQTGTGSIHEQVTTSSKDAPTVLRPRAGISSVLFWAQAARSFYQALHYDPKLAMAYVGLSYAYSPMDFPLPKPHSRAPNRFLPISPTGSAAESRSARCN